MQYFLGRISIIIPLLLIAYNASAQDAAIEVPVPKFSKEHPRPGSRRHSRMLAAKQINDLGNGAIVVRLSTKKHTIEALRNAGVPGRANRVESELREKNKRIVKAFTEEFSLCPSYFFFSDQSEKILRGNLDDVEFLNADLMVDTSIVFSHKTFLTAEFGHITEDTAKYFSHYRTEINGNWSVQRVPSYYGSNNMGFGGLIIKSDRIIQLKKPFPYYVRTFNILRSIDRSVIRMNKKLTRFHRKHS